MHAIAIRSDYMMHAHRFVSTEKFRFYLQGVHLSAFNGGTRIAACDGYRLGMFWQAGEAPKRDIIIKLDRATLKECQRSKRDTFGERYFVFEYGDESGIHNARIVSAPSAADALLVPTGAYLAVNGCAEIDGTFPDIMRVLPDVQTDDANTPSAFNADYLHSFGFVREKGSNPSIRVTYGKHGSAAMVLNAAYHEFMGVLVPMRMDKAAKPLWLAAPAPDLKVAA